MTYRPRVLEPLVEAQLRRNGAVLITGPKAVGKTTTARTLCASEVRLDRDRAARTAAAADPALVLQGERPRLIDEFQLVEGLFEAVRGQIDDEGGKGMFILTGSATPADHVRLHSGARRVAHAPMGTMSLFELGHSIGALSVTELLDGKASHGTGDRASVTTVADWICVGGWPDNLGLSVSDAIESNRDYLDVLVKVDVEQVEGVRRDPDALRRLIRSYARNIATDASLKAIGRMSADPIPYSSLKNYLAALRRLFLIEDQEPWSVKLRSRSRLVGTPKRHLADPSLAVAALGATPKRLLSDEIEWMGFLFESLMVRDLRVYSTPSRAQVRYYRDNTGLEADAIIERDDGRWIAFEIKLGGRWIDQGAANLLEIRNRVDPEAAERCAGLVVVTPESPTYIRDDGVIVTSPVVLGP
ncbi:MAG: DUF4143 domain-containing protein [Gemmatimonadota bacterium]